MDRLEEVRAFGAVAPVKEDVAEGNDSLTNAVISSLVVFNILQSLPF